MKKSRIGMVVVVAAIGCAFVPILELRVVAQEKNQQQEARQVLQEARKLCIEVGEGASIDARTRMYHWMREEIHHSLFRHIAETQVSAGESVEEIIATCEQITQLDLRAYVYADLASELARADRHEDYEAMVLKVVDLLENEADVSGSDQVGEIWANLFSSLTMRHRDLEVAEQALAKLGGSTEGMDPMKYRKTRASFLAHEGKYEEARLELRKLPAKSFAKGRAGAALMQGQGAQFYSWVVADESVYSAEHVLLGWMDEAPAEDRLALVEHFADDGTRFSLLVGIAKSLAADDGEEGKAKAMEVLKSATELANKLDPSAKLACQIDLATIESRLDGKPLSKSLQQHGMLKASRDQPWAGALVCQLLERGETKGALEYANGLELDTHTLARLVLHYAETGDFAAAEQFASKASGLLNPAMILGLAAHQPFRDGNTEQAHKWINWALAEVIKVPSTNNWFPPDDQVTLQAKWEALAKITETMVMFGLEQQVLNEFEPGVSSARRLGRGFGRQRDAESLKTWLEKLPADPQEGGLTPVYALLGLAEGLLSESSTEIFEQD